MKNDMIYTLQFARNCYEDNAFILQLPNGITKDQARTIDNLLQYKIASYGEENDEDFADMDIHDLVEATLDELNIIWKYPSVDYTIYY